ncbi:hypothetical protein N7G274_001296 [Stereocaulon virgatum]|uniref:Nephrocystin 3-like N-terminal domain-containing protein n=1 Tax=Stereocaulon virgatum TaxID=373712 RepID=A0ABR4ANG4_9LECA
MALQAINDPVKCRDNDGAVVELIYVPGFTTCREGKWKAAEDSKPFQDRLTEAFPDTRILVYGYSPDITKGFSAGTLDSEMISNAADLLLSECRRTETNRREPRSLVFACSGLGGLIVKKSLILAEALEPMTSTARRTCGIIFVGTPHAGDVESWADKFREGFGPDRDPRETISMLKACADVSSAFDKISPLYTNVHFCEKKWLECSNASLLHGECLWANIPQSHMIDSTTQHYLIPDSISEVALQTSVKGFLSYVIGAAMRRYESCHISLKYQKALKAKYIEERLPNTCTWLLEHERYRRWLDANGPACLWISGLAGTGKSILSSAIVDNLLRREHSMNVIVSCFLDENFALKTLTRSILQTLISQLESHDQSKTMSRRIRLILNDIETSVLPIPTTVFQHYLRIILADVRTDAHVFLVFDGVDSDGKMGNLITHQVVEANTPRCKNGFIKCSFSSRTPYNRTFCEDHVAEIKLGREAGIERDLMSFARYRLAKLRQDRCKEVSSLALAHQLCSRAEGVFLWIVLATDDLSRSQLVPDIFTSINSLPLGLNGLYHKALEGIPHRHIEVAIKVFSCLLASCRPMKLSELVEALRIQSGSNHAQTERNFCMQQLDGDLPNLCNSLVSITQDNVVSFAHPSIRGYFFVDSCANPAMAFRAKRARAFSQDLSGGVGLRLR